MNDSPTSKERASRDRLFDEWSALPADKGYEHWLECEVLRLRGSHETSGAQGGTSTVLLGIIEDAAQEALSTAPGLVPLPCGCIPARTAKWVRRQCGCLPAGADLGGDPTDI